MKITEITYKSGAKAIKLEPGDGFSSITNGTMNSSMVIVPSEAFANQWHDTNDDPPEPPTPEEPTIEDKAEAYDILMGVES